VIRKSLPALPELGQGIKKNLRPISGIYVNPVRIFEKGDIL